MFLLRSCGRVTNLKNEVCENGGVGGCDNVLDEYYTWPTELVAVVNMLHMLAYGHQGGAITFLTSIFTWPTELVAAVVQQKGTLVLTAGHGVIMSP